METKFLKKIVKHYLDKDYPGFDEIYITTEQIAPSRFYHESNSTYNVFLTIDFQTYLMDYFERRKEIESFIREKLYSVGGLANKTIKIYIEFPEEE